MKQSQSLHNGVSYDSSNKREIENLPEHKELLSKILDKEIIDIQVVKNRNGIWEVLYFWPDFWWFQKRARMDYEVFKRLKD